jgi:hypothetical protein
VNPTLVLHASLAILIVMLLVAVILFLVSWLSGWRSLFRVYQDRYSFVGKTWTFCSVRFGWFIFYNNCVTIGANPHGLRLSLPWFLAWGHEPLFFPWEDLDITEEPGWMCHNLMKIVPRRCPKIFFFLSGRLMSQALQERQSSFSSGIGQI